MRLDGLIMKILNQTVIRGILSMIEDIYIFKTLFGNIYVNTKYLRDPIDDDRSASFISLLFISVLLSQALPLTERSSPTQAVQPPPPLPSVSLSPAPLSVPSA